MKYKVYRNLRNGKLSIKCCKTNLVVGYADVVYMLDVKFKVGEKSRQRVIRENQKNVHAYVVGSILDTEGFISRCDDECYSNGDLRTYKEMDLLKLSTKVTYNPYIYSNFVIEAFETPVYEASICKVTVVGVYIPQNF